MKQNFVSRYNAASLKNTNKFAFCSLRSLIKFFTSSLGVFVLGAAVGGLFFAAFFGLSLVNPTATDWIFYPVTHDTAQHQIGWEFFRAGSTGGVINGLAYPSGLPVTFTDAIPLLALPFNWISAILPANFQYFGAWALANYVLMGGLAAILVRKIWLKLFQEKSERNSPWQILFVGASALIFVLSPMMIARTLYHPALAAHWLILVGILLIWEAKKFSKTWKFVAAWSGSLVGAVLIHPYFVPMLGAMMLVAGLRNVDKFTKRNIAILLVKVLLPTVLMVIVFALIGGFSLGTGAEVRDLHEKGFNLLSFANPSGFSALIPGFPNASSSPETLMWLGLGIWGMAIFAGVTFLGRYKKLFKDFKPKFRANFARNLSMTIVAAGLLIFAIGIRIDFGPITFFQYNVPDKIYEIWSAFRAAAREAWPFYYAAILLIIYAFSRAILHRKKAIAVLSLAMLAVSLVQVFDIWFSEKATTRRQEFAQIQNVSGRYFLAPEIADLVTSQRHLVMLDSGFRGDQSGTYEIAQTALKNNLTLNIGFFARIPDEIWTLQNEWRDKVSAGKLTLKDLRDNIFATRDADLANRVSQNYRVEKRGGFYFILNKS